MTDNQLHSCVRSYESVSVCVFQTSQGGPFFMSVMWARNTDAAIWSVVSCPFCGARPEPARPVRTMRELQDANDRDAADKPKDGAS